MAYQEILITLPQQQTEVLSDALFDMSGVLSVVIEDAHADSVQEQALFGEPGLELNQCSWQLSLMTVLVDVTTDTAILMRQIEDLLSLPSPLIYQVRSVMEQDWVKLTQAQFAPILIGQRICVVPSWHQAPSQVDGIVLALDPGMAFGTGSHATTRLCLEWLEAHMMPGQTVLDYGCGSGILAIAAKKLGALAVCGVDVDEQAMTAAQDNAERNKTHIEFVLPHALPLATSYNIVIANILANPLKQLTTTLCARVQKNGYLVLSGVLLAQAQDVIAHYASTIALDIWREQDGWVCLVGKK